MVSKKKKQQHPSSLIVTQSNQLVEARYNLSLGEQRLIFAMIAQIQPDDEDFKPYQIGIAEFAEFIGISKSSMYHECQAITKKLLERVIEINAKQGLLQIGWVSSAQYIDGKGVVNLSFDPSLKPYLLQLKGNFTSCRLEMLLSFKSQYTMRIYGLLKQQQNIGIREIEIQILREMLGLRQDLHTEYSNFKINLLKPAQKELKEKADLFFEFEEIKYGRKVSAIRFHIFTRKLNLTQKNLSENIPSPLTNTIDATPTGDSDLIKLIPEQHRTKKTVINAIESFEKKHGFDYVKRNILYCNAKAEKSYAGFLHNALKNDWAHDWELDQNSPVKKKVKPKEVWEREGYASEQEYAQAMFDKQMAKLSVKK